MTFTFLMMQLEPKDLFEKLEFDKVIELLEKECLGNLGKQAITSLKLYTDVDIITNLLKEVNEYKLTISDNDHFPISAYIELNEDLKMLEIEDYVLSIEGMQRVNVILLITRGILRFFNKDRIPKYPELFNIVRNIDFEKSLINSIEKVIDENGDIMPNASGELLLIRKKIISKNKELDRQFRLMINLYKKNGWLSDTVESFRNGRRVLSVPAEHKRKIRGIIHDESATGKTAFIEPEPIIDINNDIFDLEQEEKREIYRILKELSATIRPYVPNIWVYQDLIVRFDVIQAKARIAVQMDAEMPKIKAKPHFGFRNAYHPLLLLKNKLQDKKTVPFDLVLEGQNRILVLSGPNAGGKSVTMKTVGLQQLMIQAGMLVPCSPESEIGIFTKIFADIGDQQSLDDDLSTYSSRLQNMKVFLDKADEKTLILIDEFGSGTDPKIGGAIAESLLREFNNKEVFGLITTGRPGSSYAFEIAHKSGLNKKVLNYAKHKTGKNEKAIDELLIDLQREKKELEDKLFEMKAREKKLEKLIKNYDSLHRDLEFKRKKLKLENKEKSLQQSVKENKELEKLVREIREEKNLEKAKTQAAKIKEERQSLHEDVVNLKEEIYYQPSETGKEKEIKIGDFVKLRTGGASGKVDAIEKGKAIVLMGLMKMTTNVRDLIHANEPLDVRPNKSIGTDVTQSTANFESKIDLRGLSREEALKLLENFVDKALMSNVTQLKIVHGKGNGVLRNAVKMKLREYNAIHEIRHPEQNEGGDGVTIAML
jgi:DNA mismatch repair protein MutS2